jgi:hypothetical protein
MYLPDTHKRSHFAGAVLMQAHSICVLLLYVATRNRRSAAAKIGGVPRIESDRSMRPPHYEVLIDADQGEQVARARVPSADRVAPRRRPEPRSVGPGGQPAGVALPGDVTPNPVLRQDASTLIGVLAYLEGALLDGSVTEHWARKLHDRFIREGLLSPRSTDRDVRQVIKDINHRLRYAIGEYRNPPAQRPVP